MTAMLDHTSVAKWSASASSAWLPVSCATRLSRRLIQKSTPRLTTITTMP